MNILACDQFVYGFHQDLVEIIDGRRAVPDPLKFLNKEVYMRITACVLAIFSTITVCCLVPFDCFFLNYTLGCERKVDFFLVCQINIIFFKIIVVGVSALFCAIIVPKYVCTNLQIHLCIRRDIAALLAEIPLDIETLAQKTYMQLPEDAVQVQTYHNFRKHLAMHLTETLPDNYEQEIPVIFRFNFSCYTASTRTLIDEITEEVIAKKDKETEVEKSLEWRNSKIEENDNYRLLCSFYLNQNKKVPLSGSQAALKQLETAFGVEGKTAIRKKMNRLFLLIHPDKTRRFANAKIRELNKLYEFAKGYTTLAMT